MKVAVLAEQNFNLIDGSTIWLLNICKLLARQPDFETILILSHPLVDRVLADELPPEIVVRDPGDLIRMGGLPDGTTRLTPDQLGPALAALDAADGPIDRIFVRGEALIERLLDEMAWTDRLVAYAPGTVPSLGSSEPAWLSLARAARTTIVVQSETGKHALESLADHPAGAIHVVPPIVFAPEEGAPPAQTADTVPTICYSGKIDVQYGLDWLLDLIEAGQARFDLIAGKDTWRTRHPDFFARFDRLRSAVLDGRVDHVRLGSNLPHAAAKARMGEADFAWCLRHARYDDVIEISTKIVEFCMMGVPPILNDTALNRSMFGSDYPYYVDPTATDVSDRITAILATRSGPDWAHARARISQVAARFSADGLADRLGRAIRGRGRMSDRTIAASGRRLLLATHDDKFLRRFLDRMRDVPDLEIHRQDWPSTSRPPEDPQIPDGIDTVLCEWACENAVWHSHNKRPGTKLIVRLHRFEAFRDFPERIDWDAVDALIVVSDHFRDLMVAQGVDPARICVAPQYIDWTELQRPKLPQARHTLGLVGINPFEHKRFDRAVEVFARLRARDPRFRLVVRSVMPWEIPWVWDNRPDARGAFEEVFARILQDSDLRSAVRFDPAGSNMEEWYRGVGIMLSSSDSEGCHTAVMEGMASGCLPVVQDWPGARGLFGETFVHSELTDALEDVIAFADTPDLDERRAALAGAMRVHDIENFIQMFFAI